MSIFQESKPSVGHGELNGPAIASGNGKLSMKDKFSLLLNAIPSAIIYVDDQQRMQYANEGFEKIFQVSAKEITGMPVLDFLGKQAYDSLKGYREQALAGQNSSGEMEVVFKDTTRYIDFIYTPDKDEDGNLNGYVVLLNDITEKKKVEKELIRKQVELEDNASRRDQMQETIRESELRYHTLLENIPVAVYTCDAKGYINLFNKAASELWGRDPVPGKDMWCGSWKIFEPDGVTPVALETCPMAIAIKEGRKVTGREIIVELPDGQRRHVQPHPTPLFDLSGKITGAVNMLLDITDRKESEKKVALLAAIVHSSTDPIISKTLTGVITSWNEAAERLFGYTAYEMIGQPITKLMPEDRLNEEMLILERLKRGESVEHFETKRVTKNNELLDISLTISPVKDPQGNVIGASKIVRDITAQKMQELELMESIELFTAMADNVPAMIWMSGNDRFADFFNKTWLQFTGRSMEEESNERWLENVHPDDVKKCVKGYSQAFDEQKGHYVEYRLRRHDGQYRWIADNSVPRFNRDGSFAGFISACIDIDDQKNVREKIMGSELRLKTISSAAPVGLWMTDAEAKNIFVNDTWIEWTGIPCEQQMGTGWWDALLEEDKINAPAKFWDCLLKREKYSTEFRIMRPDGEIRWCLTEGSPYYDIDGGFAGYAGSVTDITEIRKMEERKDDFIKMASHELKTPITSIKGYVQLLLNIYGELSEEKFQSARPIVKSSLQTISKQVSKLTRLVSELLDLSRIESGKLELHKTQFDLADLIEETVQDVRYTTSSHAIIVHNDFEGNIYADKDRISQVLLNLLTNAIKYSPAADNVVVFAEGNNKTVRISIKDQGIGIDKKDHEKVFQRFYRVEGKSEQTYPGFGIGLFIASEIVQRHDGTIHVQSKKEQGSIFTVTLPTGLEK